MFYKDECKDSEQHPSSQTPGSFEFAKVEPSPEDLNRHGIDAEMVDCAIVIEHFHRDQEQAGNKGGTCQWQVDRPERFPSSCPEGPTGLGQATRCSREGRAAGEKDVGVENCCKNQDEPTEAVNQLNLQKGLHSPVLPNFHQGGDEGFPRLGGGIGRHIGRDRKGQDQQDGEQAAPGKLVAGDTLGGGDSEQEGEKANSSYKNSGVANRWTEEIGLDVVPGASVRARDYSPEDEDYRGEQDDRTGPGEDAPDQDSTREPKVPGP